ncbi:SCO family protein [Bremerella cremea]|uniref:SCO family protein n=1 Tax=Bremerella cremea TaxID=1031537 RepID=A0A368KJY1_9BACT|nr:SCO family protein [Bremerella cremea]RCS41078.1 SCO family protein [Bremerella cremea]
MKATTGIFVSAILLVVLGLMMMWATINRPARGPLPEADDHAGSAEAMELDRQIPPFELTSAEAEPFNTKSLAGDVWVASFFFTSCPSICKLQNQQIAILQEEFADQGVKFVSITCDPVNDTPEVLRKYAESMQAQPGVWTFLTGDMDKLKPIVEDSFQVMFETQTHSDRLMIIDKNGKLRGTFRATQDSDFRHAKKMIEKLLAEPYEGKEEPAETEVAQGWQKPQPGGMTSFQLTDSLEQPFDSKSLDGDVWLGSFFYTACPGACLMQNLEIAKLRNDFKDRGLKIVSITCDPENDTPAMLAGYASRFQADPNRWHFVRGDFDYIQKIGQEFFNIKVEKQYHSDRVFLVDREGKVIDSYRTSQPEQMKALHQKLEKMLPPAAEAAPATAEKNSTDDAPEKKD